jgi:hypothetical protein
MLRPSFSVFLVGDLGEQAVREALPAVLRAVGTSLLRRFSHIFTPASDEGPNFGIYPILLLGGVHEGEGERGRIISDSVRQLGRLAVESAGWWHFAQPEQAPRWPCVGRIVLLDDQTQKYVLTREELVSSILSFLTLAMFCGDLRRLEPEDPAGPLREFLQGAGPQVDDDPSRPAMDPDDPRLFATFGLATLDAAQGFASAYCRNRLALGIVDCMRPETPATQLGPTLEDLCSADKLGARLEGRSATARPTRAQDQLTERLRKLETELVNQCVDVSTHDTPENLLHDKYSWPWFQQLSQRLTDTCRGIESEVLPLAADEIERQGLATARESFQTLAAEVDRQVWSGPTGWHEARQALVQVEAAASREQENHRLEPVIPELPDLQPVLGAVERVRDECTLWPRPRRLWFAALSSALLLTLLVHFVPKWVYVRVFYENTVPRPGTDLSIESAQKARAADPAAKAAGGAPPAAAAASRSGLDPRYDRPGWLGNPMRFELPPSRRLARLLVDRPTVLVWLLLLLCAGAAWWVRRYLRQRQARMAAAISDLRQRISALVVGGGVPPGLAAAPGARPATSAREYFDQRLRFSRDLWVRRLLERTIDQARDDLERLNLLDRALLQQRHRYREALEELGVRFTGPNEELEDLSAIGSAQGDLIYQRLVTGDTLATRFHEAFVDVLQQATACFEESNPARVSTPAAPRTASADGAALRVSAPDWREKASFVDEARLDAFVAREVAKQLEEDGKARDPLALAIKGGDDQPVKRFFERLINKLSHSVEVLDTGDPAHPLSDLRCCFVVAPEALKDELRTLLGDSPPPVEAPPADPSAGEPPTPVTGTGKVQAFRWGQVTFIGTPDLERLHLFVGYAPLQLAAFRWLSPAAADPAAPKGSVRPSGARASASSAVLPLPPPPALPDLEPRGGGAR